MSNFPISLVCFSYLRWDSALHRPQQILTLLAKSFNVYIVEDPLFDSENGAYISFTKKGEKLWVGVPHLPEGSSRSETSELLDDLLDKFLRNEDLAKFIFWYYTPIALAYTEYFHPRLIIYDRITPLTSFSLPPYELKLLENKLFNLADLVFATEDSLHEVKKYQHENIHLLPHHNQYELLHDKMLELIKVTIKNKETLAA